MKSSLAHSHALAVKAYALYIASMVVSPLIGNKYFVVAGVPASCSVLLVPLPFFITYFFTYQYGILYARRVVFGGGIAGLVAATVLGILNQIPIAEASIASAPVWQEVMGLVPQRIICWGLLYGLAQWAASWLGTKQVVRNPILEAVITTAWGGLVVGGILHLLGASGWSSVYVPTSKVLIGSLFWFSFITLCIGSIAYVLRGIVKINPSAQSLPPLPFTYTWLLALFWTSLLLTNIVAVKWFQFKTLLFSVGIFTYPFTFAFTDIVAELYTKDHAKHAVWGGFVASVCMTGVVMLAGILPTYQGSPIHQQAFSQIFSFTPGIVLASMTAYLIAQFTDIHLFDALRSHTQGRHLWLRNNVATITSQLVDTLVFSVVAWVIWPLLDPSKGSMQVAFNDWFQLAVNEYGCKAAFALLDTPLVYGVLKLIKNTNNTFTGK